MSFDTTVHAKAVDLVKLTYQITGAAGSGHPSSGASLAHLVTVLMYTHMRHEPANPAHPASDRLILSEGHAVPIVYAACADLGVHVGKDRDSRRPLTREDAMKLRELESPVDGHPNPIEGFPFFDAATGSLGQGLSVAAGIALAARLDGLDKRVFCLIGDGESREGQVWEAIDFIKDEDLKAVLPIFNANQYAQSDAASPQQSAETLSAKLDAAGFEVREIDGHNPTQIQQALSDHAQRAMDPQATPIAIVARTVKGWGAPSQQQPPSHSHGKAVTGDDLKAVLEEIDKTGRELGALADTALKIPLLPGKKPEPPTLTPAPTFDDALKKFGQEKVLEKGAMAVRKAYGVGIESLGHAHTGVVCLDGDVRGSTGADAFAKDQATAARFVDCRIAEQNMISVAAGLNAGGKIPFVSTFGKFMTRAYDQIEMAVNSGLNFKLIGSHAGITLGPDGPSQMALPDVAWFRAFSTMDRPDGSPGFYILQPADAYAAYSLTFAMAEHHGPCYMRTLRPDTEFIYSADTAFKLGGHEVLVGGRDLLIVASGYMVHEANKALDLLDKQGIDATLVDLYSLPFDGDALMDLANDNNGMVLTIEDNYGGSMGSAVADAAAATGDGFTVNQMHLRRLPKSAKSHDQMLEYCGLSANHIAEQAMAMLQLTGA